MAEASRWSLQGMTALVTGGTKGIGHAVVEELAGFGATVHTCARDETHLSACLRDWEKKGFRVTGSICDVSSPAQRQELMDTVSCLFNGKLNILINNAGMYLWKPTEGYTAEDLSTVMATNFESVFHICQLAHPLLKTSGVGSIVFISSVAGVMLDLYMEQVKEQSINLQRIWHVSGRKTISGVTVLHLGAPELHFLRSFLVMKEMRGLLAPELHLDG